MTKTACFPFCRLKGALVFFSTGFGDFICWPSGKHSVLPFRDGGHFPDWDS